MAAIEAAARQAGRALQPGDAGALLPLSAEAGWNQTADDWRFMLETGQGIGVVDRDGRFIASALAFPVATDVCWISMVLTTERWRRQGIGTRLLRRAIGLARTGGRGAAGRVAGLDATELGAPIYAALGFRALYSLRRWRLERGAAPMPPPSGVSIRKMRREDLPAIAAFDAARSALRRPHVVAHLFARAPDLAQVAEADGRVVGYGLGRDGRIAMQIGPIVADDEGVALALVAAAAQATTAPLFLDVPDLHAGLRHYLTEAGGTAPRGFTRMVLGDAPAGLGDASRVFALAGPELA